MTTVSDYLKEIGTKGGTTTADRYGKDYYKELQKKSVESRKKNKKRG